MKAPPIQMSFDEKNPATGELKPAKAWVDWTQQLADNGSYLGAFATAERPTNTLKQGHWMIDTTLGRPIFYYNGGWIDATGISV